MDDQAPKSELHRYLIWQSEERRTYSCCWFYPKWEKRRRYLYTPADCTTWILWTGQGGCFSSDELVHLSTTFGLFKMIKVWSCVTWGQDSSLSTSAEELKPKAVTAWTQNISVNAFDGKMGRTRWRQSFCKAYLEIKVVQACQWVLFTKFTLKGQDSLVSRFERCFFTSANN